MGAKSRDWAAGNPSNAAASRYGIAVSLNCFWSSNERLQYSKNMHVVLIPIPVAAQRVLQNAALLQCRGAQ